MRSENKTICSIEWCNPRHSIFSRLHVVNSGTKSSSLRNEEKWQFSTAPYKLLKKEIRGRLKCSDFDGTTTIRRQIWYIFSIACYMASKPTGNGQYAVGSSSKVNMIDFNLVLFFSLIRCWREWIPWRRKWMKSWLSKEAPNELRTVLLSYTRAYNQFCDSCLLDYLFTISVISFFANQIYPVH